ncbi:MAG: hypothetical protein K0Q59_468 [Paenibacillus sp.]|nr:hypothetical protein [Paenibacillus sp.]
MYVRLYKALKEQILTGLIKPGEYLLPENDLCKYYSLSRNSVRKALDELHKEGLVIKKVGLGTFVPADIDIPAGERKKLRIIAPFPAYFAEYGLDILSDAFRDKYPHVDIHVLCLPPDAFLDALLEPDKLGFYPDVVLVAESQLAMLEDRGRFADLEPTVRDSLSTMYPKLCRSFFPNPRITAVPVTMTTVCLAYNPGLFAARGVPSPAPDWNVDDFEAAAERLTTVSDGLIDCFGFSLYTSLNRWLVFALQNGMSRDGADNRQKIVKSLDKLQDWLHRKRIATVYMDSRNLINPFIYGKSAMTLTTLFETASWKERGIGFTPEFAPLPFGETKATLLQTNLLMIPGSAPDPGLSQEYIRIALQADVQQRMCERTPFLSVLGHVNEVTRSAAFLQAINIGDGLIDNNYFLQELIDQQIDQSDLLTEMGLFWLGLQDAETIAEHF